MFKNVQPGRSVPRLAVPLTSEILRSWCSVALPIGPFCSGWKHSHLIIHKQSNIGTCTTTFHQKHPQHCQGINPLRKTSSQLTRKPYTLLCGHHHSPCTRLLIAWSPPSLLIPSPIPLHLHLTLILFLLPCIFCVVLCHVWQNFTHLKQFSL